MSIHKPYLLRLIGSPREMGRIHGQAALEAKALGAAQYYGSFWDSLFSFEPLHPFDLALRKGLRRLLNLTFERNLIENIPSYYREMLEGFSLGSGLPYDLVAQGAVMPDLYAFLLGHRYRFSASPGFDSVYMGCTSFVTFPKTAREGSLIHARNLDYPGGKLWNYAPAVIEFEPEDGQKYVSITSLGLHTAGVTSTNESGISLSLHVNYSVRVSSSGTPILVIGSEIMRRARTLSEAVEVLRCHPAAGGWSFMLSSAKENRAISAQFDASSLSVTKPETQKTVLTNHFLSSDQVPSEYWITAGRKMDTEARYRRSEELLSAKSELEPKDAAAILSDHFDPYAAQVRSFGSTVNQVHTSSSVIFQPGLKKVHVAFGPAPTACRTYHAFNLFPGPYATEEWIEGHAWDGAHEAREEYGNAFEAYFPSGKMEQAERHLVEAVRLQPEELLYRFMLGVIRLKCGNLMKARADFERALEAKDSAHRKAWVRLYLGRTLDAMGEREKAREHYRQICEDRYFGLRARKGMRKPWDLKKARRLILDFTLGEVIERS